MNFKFNELRTIQAISLLLTLEGGVINSSKLMMLLYIIDNDLLVKHGYVLTGDKYLKTRKGIILCEVKNRLNKPGMYARWREYIDGNKIRVWKSISDAIDSELSDNDVEVIKSVQSEFQDYDFIKIQGILCECFPELKDDTFYGLITHEMIMSMHGINSDEIKTLSDEVQYHNDIGDYLKKIH